MFEYFGKEERCSGSRGKSFIWSIAFLERRINVLVTKDDLGLALAPKMELFVIYSNHIKVYPELSQTSKTESLTKTVHC